MPDHMEISVWKRTTIPMLLMTMDMGEGTSELSDLALTRQARIGQN